MNLNTIIVTGAARGIGRALCLKLAKSGVSLGILDLDSDELEQTANDCRALGANVTTGTVNICDRRKLKKWASEFDKKNKVDLVIANAGVSPATSKYGPGENPLLAAEIVQINLIGTINTVNCLLPQMAARRRGQIAMMSSIAAYVATGDSPSYCASKAGILAYGRGMRHRLRDVNVRVTVICPGYVQTQLTDKFDHAAHMRITADDAADRILKGLARNSAEVAFPFSMQLLSRLVYALPEGIRRRWIDKYQYK